jgi:hypothetical protein
VPWSEWQDPIHVDGTTELTGSLASVNASRQVAGVNDANALLSQTIADALAATPAPGSVLQEAGVDQGPGDTADPADGTGTHVGISQLVYSVDATRFLTYRDWFPSPLRTMTEGVDYDVIPGKDPGSDDDAYVEYESGDNSLAGWQPWTVPVEYQFRLQVGPNSSAPDPPNIPFRVAVAPLPMSAWPAYGVGSQAAHLDTFPTPDYGTQDVPVLVPSSVLQFALVFQPDTLNGWHPTVTVAPPPPLSEFQAGSGVQGFVNPVAVRGGGSSTPVITGPVMPFDTPRWRYWIPGDVAYPIRQRQRNDGLGRGVMRARSTSSVQSSVRQRGYR